MGPLNDEIKLRKEQQKLKKLKNLNFKNIINFRTIRYQLTALGKIFHSYIKYKLMRPVSILRLHKA